MQKLVSDAKSEAWRRIKALELEAGAFKAQAERFVNENHVADTDLADGLDGQLSAPKW